MVALATRLAQSDPGLNTGYSVNGGSVQNACARNKLIGNKSPQQYWRHLWENNYPDVETFSE